MSSMIVWVIPTWAYWFLTLLDLQLFSILSNPSSSSTLHSRPWIREDLWTQKHKSKHQSRSRSSNSFEAVGSILTLLSPLTLHRPMTAEDPSNFHFKIHLISNSCSSCHHPPVDIEYKLYSPWHRFTHSLTPSIQSYLLLLLPSQQTHHNLSPNSNTSLQNVLRWFSFRWLDWRRQELCR